MIVVCIQCKEEASPLQHANTCDVCDTEYVILASKPFKTSSIIFYYVVIVQTTNVYLLKCVRVSLINYRK